VTSDDFGSRVATAIAPYRQLLVALVEGRLPAEQFEREYQHIYLHDETDFDDDVFAVVDRFFADADEFVADPVLRGQVEDGIGPDELKRLAFELLEKAGCHVVLAAR
jgi:hypothetical protein